MNENIKIPNYWMIKNIQYWCNELSVDEDKITWWVNVGYHLPLCGTSREIKKLLAVSGNIYSSKFN